MRSKNVAKGDSSFSLYIWGNALHALSDSLSAAYAAPLSLFLVLIQKECAVRLDMSLNFFILENLGICLSEFPKDIK